MILDTKENRKMLEKLLKEKASYNQELSKERSLVIIDQKLKMVYSFEEDYGEIYPKEYFETIGRKNPLVSSFVNYLNLRAEDAYEMTTNQWNDNRPGGGFFSSFPSIKKERENLEKKREKYHSLIVDTFNHFFSSFKTCSFMDFEILIECNDDIDHILRYIENNTISKEDLNKKLVLEKAKSLKILINNNETLLNEINSILNESKSS